jgi:hypothetical protein
MPCQAAMLRKITLQSTVRLKARGRPVFPVHVLIISMLDISDDSILDASVNAVMKTD